MKIDLWLGDTATLRDHGINKVEYRCLNQTYLSTLLFIFSYSCKFEWMYMYAVDAKAHKRVLDPLELEL